MKSKTEFEQSFEFHPDLEKAVFEEIRFQQELENNRKKSSIKELRQQGLSIFPVEILSSETEQFGQKINFRTSFLISDHYFRRGCNVVVHCEDEKITGRMVDFSPQAGTILLDDQSDKNWKESTIRIDYLEDDRTLKCLELGARLAFKHPQLLRFQSQINRSIESLPFVNSKLNEPQQKVVGAILSGQETVIIQGPPGTGKTHTLAIAIAELVQEGKRVIVSAPSNAAVDNLCISLISKNIPLLRVGNEEKMHAQVKPFSIFGVLNSKSGAKTIQLAMKQLRKVSQIANRHSRNFTKEVATEKQQARKEMRELQREIRQFGRKTELDLIVSSPVIAGTPVGLFHALPKEFSADCVVFDEAGQALAPLTWLVASFGKQLVLCGDPQQIPPTVNSPEAARLGLGISLLEEITRKYTPLVLTLQYRMSDKIMHLINAYFYKNQLISYNPKPTSKIQFIDMAGFGEGEQKDEISGSTFHQDEVAVVARMILEEKLDPKTTVILSPYSAQIQLLKDQLDPTWRVATIDSFQGQESETIVICLTRANDRQQIGFLADYRRMNVAISRAKMNCYIFGDSVTIGNDPFYGKLIHYFEEIDSYKSAWEFST